MKRILVKARALALLFWISHCAACSAFTPAVQSPCPGLWCFSVAEIPGPEFCYASPREMEAAKSAYDTAGYKVTVIK